MKVARTTRFGLPQINSAAAKLAIALVVGSVLFGISESLRVWICLDPVLVLKHFALWQLVTYAFIETNALNIIFGALIIWSIGGALEATWGSRRLVVFTLGIAITSAVATVLLSLVFDGLQARARRRRLRCSGWPGGLRTGGPDGQAQTNFWGMPVTGNVLALIGIGFVVLSGIFEGWKPMVPALFAIAATWAYFRGANPRLWWLRLQSWRFRRQMKSRSAHLKIVGKERNMPSDSDRYLH